MDKADFIEQLLDFRTTYLRGVARAAVDLEFRRDLTGPDPLGVLQRSFGYTCPWDLTLVLHDLPDRGPRVNPANGSVMTLPYYGESITVYIPKRPSDDPKVQMDALAAYYHSNPWFLRNKSAAPPLKGAPKGGVLGTVANPPPIDLPPVAQPKWSSVVLDPDRNTRFDLGDNFDHFISFAAGIFNAVALAWHNDLFMSQITAYTAKGDQPRTTTIEILDSWLGYKYPWQLDLIVQVDEDAKYDPAAGTWTLKPPELMLTLPWMTGATQKGPVPPNLAAEAEVAENLKHPSVAVLGIALYNTDGPGYPFTCG